jgi:nucleotide-binding universal stress UspA family protein
LSEYSKDALHIGCQIKDTIPDVEIVCHYIYETPSIALIEEELQDDYRKYYEEESDRKMKDFKETCTHREKVEGHFTHWKKANVSDHIVEEAEANEADMIIMSSTGKSKVSSFLIGSTSYELVRKQKKIPLLVVKKRIDKVRSWDVLMNLPM